MLSLPHVHWKLQHIFWVCTVFLLCGLYLSRLSMSQSTFKLQSRCVVRACVWVSRQNAKENQLVDITVVFEFQVYIWRLVDATYGCKAEVPLLLGWRVSPNNTIWKRWALDFGGRCERKTNIINTASAYIHQVLLWHVICQLKSNKRKKEKRERKQDYPFDFSSVEDVLVLFWTHFMTVYCLTMLCWRKASEVYYLYMIFSPPIVFLFVHA